MKTWEGEQGNLIRAEELGAGRSFHGMKFGKEEIGHQISNLPFQWVFIPWEGEGHKKE